MFHCQPRSFSGGYLFRVNIYAISNSKVMPFKVKKQQTQKLRTIQSAQYIPIRPIDIIHLRIDLELWFWVANKIIRNAYFHLPLDPKTIYTKVIKPLKKWMSTTPKIRRFVGFLYWYPLKPRLPSFFNSIFFGSSNLFNSHGHLRHFNPLYGCFRK